MSISVDSFFELKNPTKNLTALADLDELNAKAAKLKIMTQQVYLKTPKIILSPIKIRETALVSAGFLVSGLPLAYYIKKQLE